MSGHDLTTPFFGTEAFAIAEAGAALIVLLIAFTAPLSEGRIAKRVGALVSGLTARPWLCVLLAGIAAPLLRLALLPLIPIPQPYYHDEFSYLLAADTFASGRLTNPTHPLWVHFETFHVTFQPTYMSMYFPAQGLVLALGRVLFGNPWFGVCLAIGAMCAALTWMLQAWVSPGWALLGSLLVVLRLGVLSYWMNSYWGGALSATGGALVVGALPRLLQFPRVRTGLILGVGVAMLANSRPFEGVVLCLAVTVALVRWLTDKTNPPVPAGPLIRRGLLPAALVLASVAAALGYYDWRVFGRPSTLPYQVNRATYAVSPFFLWQTPRPEPEYRHKEIREFYVHTELDAFRQARTPMGFVTGVAWRAFMLVDFYFGAVLAIGLLMVPRLLSDSRGRFLLLAGAVFFVGILVNAFILAHYLAAAAGLSYAILMLCLERLSVWRPGGRPLGSFLLTAISAVSVLLFLFHLGSVAMGPKGDMPRTQVQHMLEGLGGPQLAIVRYLPDHDPRDEWVYNAADIDASGVVWAREMGRVADVELLDYYRGRTVWLVEPDQSPPRVTPYVR